MRTRARRFPDMLREPPCLYVYLVAEIGGRPARIRFPDTDHLTLYEYGLTLDPIIPGEQQPCGSTGRALYRAFSPWIIGTVRCGNPRCKVKHEGFSCTRDVNEFALDYVITVHDAQPSKEGTIEAPLFIEPDLIADWWRQKAEELFCWINQQY